VVKVIASRGNPNVTRVFLVFAVLSAALLTWGSGSPQAAFLKSPGPWELSESRQLVAHHQPQQDESQVKKFRGKILKSGDKFVLEESSNEATTAPICWMIKLPQRSMKDKEWW
jgi:hypothetical protein